ncbi:putative S-adenosyl-L-methionine-dependent methyltransferase [Helianthus anomalus]
MATKGNPKDNITLVIVVGLCCFFYLLGAWQRSGFGKGDSIAQEVTKSADCCVLLNLNVESHHGNGVKKTDDLRSEIKVFGPCDDRFVDYTPCHDQMCAMTFPRENMNYRERHCPPENEKFQSYSRPESFPHGADAYIDQLASVIPINNGMVRTALDTGCGVASWGAYLFKKNVTAMSFAPRDSHEAQVQFALERGVPTIIGVLGTIKLPYPFRAFDMANCSRCLIPWCGNSGKYMMEVDRVLRPGGYWVLSGPPINWRANYKSWQRPKDELENEQRNIEETAKLLCWEKNYEKGETAIWRKRVNKSYCQERDSRVTMCKSKNADDVWYKEMEACVTPYPETDNNDDVSGGELKPFPERLNDVTPRITSDSVPGISVELFLEDNKLWQKHVNAYKRVNKIIDSGRYHNIMDMNAGLGSFAAALESPKSWVMNVMPTVSKKDTLGVIF